MGFQFSRKPSNSRSLLIYAFLTSAEHGYTANLSGSDAALALDGSDEQSSNDPKCSTNGEPWDADTNAVMLDTKVGHAEGVFYCLINSNVKDKKHLKVSCPLIPLFSVH